MGLGKLAAWLILCGVVEGAVDSDSRGRWGCVCGRRGRHAVPEKETGAWLCGSRAFAKLVVRHLAVQAHVLERTVRRCALPVVSPALANRGIALARQSAGVMVIWYPLKSGTPRYQITSQSPVKWYPQGTISPGYPSISTRLGRFGPPIEVICLLCSSALVVYGALTSSGSRMCKGVAYSYIYVHIYVYIHIHRPWETTRWD